MDGMAKTNDFLTRLLAQIDSIDNLTPELINNLKIAFHIIESKSVLPLRLTLPLCKEDITIIDLQASIETIVDLNIELAKRTMATLERFTDYPVYFSAPRNIKWGWKLTE